MSLLVTSLQRLRSNPHLQKAPPYLSLLCILGGVFWLLLLPLNRNTRQTYISENALLPGQVHTYFAGSEQNVFRAYQQELRAIPRPAVDSPLSDPDVLTDDWLQKISEIFEIAGLPAAAQSFEYRFAGNTTRGTNVYSVLQAPRGDGTEAILLAAPRRNAAGEDNTNGVALVLTLAHYFKRWSLWSKDIILLITPDTDSGPLAWISAYHSTHDPEMVESLPLKSGALQGAVCVDLPFDHRFEKLSVSYDGVNGQLPNLDLVNTAVSVASGQMGIGTSIQGMHKHDHSYRSHLITMLRGMSNQAAGYGTGAHAVFMPYHIAAITLTAVGEGRQDEMALGRTVESICRSLNNLLEHFHQSFFFYLLMQTNRFVSIGTYLPSAMAIAAGFTIMSISLWVKSGSVRPASPVGVGREVASPTGGVGREVSEDSVKTVVRPGDRTQSHSKPADRQLLTPILIILSAHSIGLIPVYVSTTINPSMLATQSPYLALVLLALPPLAARLLSPMAESTSRLTKSLSLILLGLYLSTLATLNFSLSLFLGLLCTPILIQTSPSLVKSNSLTRPFILVIVSLISPPGLWLLCTAYFRHALSDPDWPTRTLQQVAFGWNVLGVWGPSVGVWGVWWPAWAVASLLAWCRNPDGVK